jgi:L-iditol 2-dehydrogenase
MLRPGGVGVLLGIPAEDRIDFDIHTARRRELVLQNVRRQNRCLQTALDLVTRGAVNVDPLATHHFDLQHTQEAFETVAEYRDGVVKAMIHVNKAG